MIVLENVKEINDVIKLIAEFIQSDEYVHIDFDEYIKTIGKPSDNTAFQAACFNYIFERRLGEERKSIPDLYLERQKGLSASTKKIVKALKKSISSVFEIHKIAKNGFILYNIINEKTYEVSSLVKMTTFRGMGPGQYVVARIFEYEKEYYLLEISGVLSTTRRDDVYRFAIAKIIQNPEIVYIDNPKKAKEIEKEIKETQKKFLDYFGTDEIITTNKFADDVIGLFNDFAEGGEKADYSDKIQLPEQYQFFNVEEFNNSYDNFLENSLGGFSSHKETYDVGIVYDEELGMYAVPFWGTFNKIFEILVVTQTAVHFLIILRVIAVGGGFKERADIDGRHAQVLHMVDPGKKLLHPVLDLCSLIFLRCAQKAQRINMIKNCLVIPMSHCVSYLQIVFY